MSITYSSCGHTTKGAIVLDSNPLSLSAYLTWAEDEKHLDKKDICFPCWCDKQSDNTSYQNNKEGKQ